MTLTTQEMIGKTFGKLTVIGEAPRNGSALRLWLCTCACGSAKVAKGTKLRNGKTKSCGCIKKMQKASKNPAYGCWTSMKDRCLNKNGAAYDRYGGRGIFVCDRWKVFENFLADMGPRPSPKHSIDRTNNDDGYYPSNCRWATSKEQCLNRRKPRRAAHCRNGHPRTPENTVPHDNGGTRCKICIRETARLYAKTRRLSDPDFAARLRTYNREWARKRKSAQKKETPKPGCARNNLRLRTITANSKTQTTSEWSRETGINKLTLISRLNRGWDHQKIISHPIDGRRSSRRKNVANS